MYAWTPLPNFTGSVTETERYGCDDGDLGLCDGPDMLLCCSMQTQSNANRNEDFNLRANHQNKDPTEEDEEEEMNGSQPERKAVEVGAEFSKVRRVCTAPCSGGLVRAVDAWEMISWMSCCVNE
ncbi:hypothetical protein C1H46_027379 [Malus baccata]|uniref:Uncharacterized protein n=1 Tax=Malus baccata TaxID=106549 RepID=A0A540LKP7_MALBA|nr:hypothetical protein C1H46_027379 [Malus baccata]